MFYRMDHRPGRRDDRRIASVIFVTGASPKADSAAAEVPSCPLITALVQPVQGRLCGFRSSATYVFPDSPGRRRLG
jgi:hypothetical protein